MYEPLRPITERLQGLRKEINDTRNPLDRRHILFELDRALDELEPLSAMKGAMMSRPTLEDYLRKVEEESEAGIGLNLQAAGASSPTTAPTFDPDWGDIANVVACSIGDSWADYARAAIAEYQRQLAEAGIVLVRREDVQFILNNYPHLVPGPLVAVLRRLNDTLAPTQEDQHE